MGTTSTLQIPRPEAVRAELRRLMHEARIARSLLRLAERAHAPREGRVVENLTAAK